VSVARTVHRSVVDVAGTEQNAASTGRIDAPCTDAPIEAGELARWVCWWAGGGWNLRLVIDGEGVALRSQPTDEGMTKPGKWEDLLWLAVPAGPGIVLHRDAEREAAADRATEPAPAAEGAPPVELRVQFTGIRGSEVTLWVQDGKRLHALARSPWLPGAHTTVDPGDALAAWRLVDGDAVRDLRLITGGARVALQQRRGAEPWEDVVRVALPRGRAVKLSFGKKSG